MIFNLKVSANFRVGSALPTIDEHCIDLWTLAKSLRDIGFPLDEWHPPANTLEQSLRNPAFTDAGPSTAALAMAKADRDNHDSDLRNLGVWNGKDNNGGGAIYTVMHCTGAIPSHLHFRCEEVKSLRDYRNVIKLIQGIVMLWKPMLVQIAHAEYDSVFPDRPGAGWMLYLPFKIDSQQVPEAAQIITIMDDAGKKQFGTLIVTVEETFDMENEEHVKRANAIETRLVDQDLLPTNAEFVEKF
ncbi:Imm52 family immunity protein [Massilia sp. YIM B02763]|uniref:Imm52 family immunity protein n=1 Tax=Massilia sp. YIM B02763 TaxID=3050130 RepID=UPI0025B71C12|nr:Imm52 family immunity protein [Massilia sp. YIM B02763]MDN4055963.1 Imm52 family immunity protein [Massilia sp. YIM B02763]